MKNTKFTNVYSATTFQIYYDHYRDLIYNIRCNFQRGSTVFARWWIF